MRDHHPLSSSDHHPPSPLESIAPTPTASDLSACVLGEFQVEQHQLLVVSLEPSSLLDHELDQYIELERFTVQGKQCAIVQLKNTSPIEVEIAKLLTDRELQIATLIASGQSNKQVAKQLQISEWTVSTHLRRIFIKLGVDSRAAMVYCCASLIQSWQVQAKIHESPL
jgi:DNA-binding CsgD family transcriptional regulator